ncbi:type IX secretion system sortase PorU [Belliella kenyensis]|uniref:Type IX secretion system sortase PorU n=1 Tax=Belliella kenyensis TaxID=1472724 RepID=A0ABV8EL75_9BACT|nr:type IX secretion system sortase PorU [Belliella kenyensis]MCH7400641.1 type IX secretion system sortase PorU [Belliella kenyensis]MDN3602072.1 type IX secretion system sortase PorU [Belliella kenyensis]
MNIQQHRSFLSFLLFSISFWLFFSASFAQDGHYKFPITKSGVYKISQNQLNSLGFDQINQVSIYGNAGMLPQKLDVKDLKLREIPTQIIDNELFVFLEGPHHNAFLEEGWVYQHHIYTDTAYYVLGKSNTPLKVDEESTQAVPPYSPVYQIATIKEDQTNLLTSGRNWYSQPIFSGQNYSQNIEIPIHEEPIRVKFELMAQSLQENNIRININGQDQALQSLPAIPNSTYGIKGREGQFNFDFSASSSSTLSFRINYQTNDPNGALYINKIIAEIPINSQQLPEGIFHHIGSNTISVQTNNNLRIWRIPNLHEVTSLGSNGQLREGDKLAVFSSSLTPRLTVFTPVDLSLRNSNERPRFIIICHPTFTSEANRLATHKRQLGINTKVIELQEIFNNFSYGTYDITAIRNYLAHEYHQGNTLEHVLLLGKSTIDYKGKYSSNRPNLVPSYSSRNSLNPLATYSSDDYYGFLDWGGGEWEESTNGDERMVIGVGRIPAINHTEAREIVSKIISYELKTNQYGEWKRKITLFADDGDGNIHLNDAESHAAYIQENFPAYHIEKIYLDRFEQIRIGGRQTSPEARAALREAIDQGTLILNYIGHGNETTLTAEQVFQINDFRNWPENKLLPLVVTATCEFGKHDSPFVRSGAEEMLFAPRKGAIALLTTGRPVFSSINFVLNKAFIESVFEQSHGEPLALGEIFKRTKNNSLNGSFNRNFSLLGDPTLRLATPELESQIDEYLDIELETQVDTLKAMQRIRLTGTIIDPITGAQVMQAGEYQITLRDKPITRQTLGDESNPTDFAEEGHILFKGTGLIADGKFESEIFIPQNINYTVGNGKISTFATLRDGTEAMGANKVLVGGSDSPPNDILGPEIKLKFGYEYGDDLESMRSANIKLQAFFTDESGVNISSNNLGQDILLYINDQEPIVLNYKYASLENSFQKGMIETPLEGLREGVNTIRIEAWDNVGNFGFTEREVLINGSLDAKVLEIKNYPNPATDYSKFVLKHNQSGKPISVTLKVYTITGHKIYESGKRYVEADYEINDLEWIFFHSKTNYPTKGTYIYELQLMSEIDQSTDTVSGKILIK